MTETYQALINDKMNGNISTFKKELNKLNKVDLLGFIHYWVNHESNASYQYIIDICIKYLEN